MVIGHWLCTYHWDQNEYHIPLIQTALTLTGLQRKKKKTLKK